MIWDGWLCANSERFAKDFVPVPRADMTAWEEEAEYCSILNMKAKINALGESGESICSLDLPG